MHVQCRSDPAERPLAVRVLESRRTQMTDITWLGHSTFYIDVGDGPAILIDPWFTGNPSYPSGFNLERVDVLLVTHGHFDHIADALAVAERFKPAILCGYEVSIWLESKGAENIVGMNTGGSAESHGLRVTMTQAWHSSSIDDGGRQVCAGLASGFVVRQPDGRAFYHAGDTDVFSDMQLIRRLHHPQLAMLPIGDLFTMGPEGAALACEFLRPEVVLPMHYGTFPVLTGTPTALVEALGPGSAVAVPPLEPGGTYRW